MAPSIETRLEEVHEILEQHQKGFREELNGTLVDLEPYIESEQRQCLKDALEDFISATNDVMEEIDEAELAPSNCPGSGHHNIHNCWDR